MKKITRRFWAVVMCLVMVLGLQANAGVNVFAESVSEEKLSVGFYVLSEEQARPLTFEDYSKVTWKCAQFGYIKHAATVLNDTKNVEDLLVEVPKEANKYVGEGQKIEWFSIRQSGYRYYVYGQVMKTSTEVKEESIKREAVISGFWLLNKGQERPDTFAEYDNVSWKWGEFGKISQAATIINDETAATALVEEIPEKVNSMIGENEKVKWFSIRMVGYRYYVYGEIVQVEEVVGKTEVTAKPTVVPTEQVKTTIKPTAEIANEYKYSVKCYLVQDGKDVPDNFDDYSNVDWIRADYGTSTKVRDVLNDIEAMKEISIDAPKAESLLKNNQEIEWFSMKSVGYRYCVYGRIITRNAVSDCLIGANKTTVVLACTATPIIKATICPTKAVVTSTPVINKTVTGSAAYYIMAQSEDRPQSIDELSNYKFKYADYGILYSPKQVYGEKIVEQMLCKIPVQTNNFIEAGEAIHWFAVKQSGYSHVVYGQVYNVKLEKSLNNGAVVSDAKEVCVDTVDDIKNLKDIYHVGTVIKTRGFYEKNDGGAAKYIIQYRGTKSKYTSFETQVGQFANIVVENEKVNMLQLGAGKCETIIYNTSDVLLNDDGDRFNEAISLMTGCENGEIYFPTGEYRCASKIYIGGANYTIKGDGNKTIIYTDNGYKGDEHFMTICGSNITLKDVRVEARETKNRGYYRQCSVMFASDINILNCEFSAKSNVISYDGNTDRQYTNITLYSGWHNVVVDGCILEQTACVERGACMGLLDIWSNGCSNAVVRNCTMTQNAHDEMLGIFTGQKLSAGIENVVIENNKMYSASASNVSDKTMVMTVAYDSSQNIKNIYFRNNYMEADIPSNLMSFGKLENCVIEDNEFVVNNPYTKGANVLFDARKGVTIRNNKIEVSGKSGFGSICKNEAVFENNYFHSTVNINMGAYHGTKLKNNEFHFDKGCFVIANSPEEVIGNYFEMKNGFTFDFFMYDMLTTDSTIVDNTFIYDYDDTKDMETQASSFAGAVIFAGFHATLSDHTITFSRNKINAICNSANKSVLTYGYSDATPQNFVIEDNVLDKYYYVRSVYGQKGNVSYNNNNKIDDTELRYEDYQVRFLDKTN
ncbi:MAG: right-handed parallel beta-helix repeat-containing protein [Lachnospiraceae bacterium]|nr:right-handed parallel beta-helix repeat-containing protein [Lachnospiraceae bacterium]